MKCTASQLYTLVSHFFHPSYLILSFFLPFIYFERRLMGRWDVQRSKAWAGAKVDIDFSFLYSFLLLIIVDQSVPT
jgi:hypothetical protein